MRHRREAVVGQFAGNSAEAWDKAVLDKWPYPRVAERTRRPTSIGWHENPDIADAAVIPCAWQERSG
jgi:hypothetical protein